MHNEEMGFVAYWRHHKIAQFATAQRGSLPADPDRSALRAMLNEHGSATFGVEPVTDAEFAYYLRLLAEQEAQPTTSDIRR